MNSKKKWAARGAVLALSASVLTGVTVASGGSASALGSTCTPPAQRPSGPLVSALAPTLGWPGYPLTPLGDAWVPVVATVDAVICPLLP